MSATSVNTPTAEEQRRDELNKQLKAFVDRANEHYARNVSIQQWHTDAFLSAGIPLPYSHNDTHVGSTVRGYDDNGDYVIDVQATNKAIARIVQYITKRGYKVNKDYDNDTFKVSFEWKINDDETSNQYDRWTNTVKMVYSFERSSVCEKRVVGTKVIPARIEEVYEYDCNPVSYLAMDTSE